MVWSGLVWSICIMTQGIIRITCEPIVPLCHWIKSAPWSKIVKESTLQSPYFFACCFCATRNLVRICPPPRNTLSFFFCGQPFVVIGTGTNRYMTSNFDTQFQLPYRPDPNRQAYFVEVAQAPALSCFFGFSKNSQESTDVGKITSDTVVTHW